MLVTVESFSSVSSKVGFCLRIFCCGVEESKLWEFWRDWSVTGIFVEAVRKGLGSTR